MAHKTYGTWVHAEWFASPEMRRAAEHRLALFIVTVDVVNKFLPEFSIEDMGALCTYLLHTADHGRYEGGNILGFQFDVMSNEWKVLFTHPSLVAVPLNSLCPTKTLMMDEVSTAHVHERLQQRV